MQVPTSCRLTRWPNYRCCLGYSSPESSRDRPQSLLRVPRACGEIPSCLGSRFCERDDDTLQDVTVRAPGILLQFLRYWSQRFEDIGLLLDHSQWVNKQLASLTRIR